MERKAPPRNPPRPGAPPRAPPTGLPRAPTAMVPVPMTVPVTLLKRPPKEGGEPERPKPTDCERTLDRNQKEEILREAQKMLDNIPDGLIENTQISVFSYDELKKMAVAEITEDKSEGKFSINDCRLGITENNRPCDTCHQNNMRCDGHLGMIELAELFYHPLYIRNIIQVLNSVCNSCSNLFLTESDLKKDNVLRYHGHKRLELIETLSAKLDDKLAVCREVHPPDTKPCGPRYVYVSSKIKDTGQIMYKMKGEKPKKGDKGERDTGTVRPIKEVFEVLTGISDEDAKLMGFEHGSHPRDLILRALPVIPPIARPPQVREGVFYANPLTKLYQDIIRQNNLLKPDSKADDKTKGEARKKVHFFIEHLIDNSDRRYATHRNKAFDSIKDLIQTKEGLVRGLMMGKRVNYSARTVAGPGPNLNFGEAGVPEVMAPFLTVPVIVTSSNREVLQRFLNPTDPNEPSRITHITQNHGKLKGNRYLVTPYQREHVRLEVGDRVERWLQNGDYIVMNRQPTLHKQSMMGYKVVLHKYLTVRAHLAYTTPLNLDFKSSIFSWIYAY